MRFFLDPDAAYWFRRLFLHPVKARKGSPYRDLLRDSWVQDEALLDLTETGENQKFVTWLIRQLRRRGRASYYSEAFVELAGKIEEARNRSAIDRLGDLVDAERTKFVVNPTTRPSVRVDAVRKRLRDRGRGSE